MAPSLLLLHHAKVSFLSIFLRFPASFFSSFSVRTSLPRHGNVCTSCECWNISPIFFRRTFCIKNGAWGKLFRAKRMSSKNIIKQCMCVYVLDLPNLPADFCRVPFCAFPKKWPQKRKLQNASMCSKLLQSAPDCWILEHIGAESYTEPPDLMHSKGKTDIL